jgi:hypothetical protein
MYFFNDKVLLPDLANVDNQSQGVLPNLNVLSVGLNETSNSCIALSSSNVP